MERRVPTRHDFVVRVQLRTSMLRRLKRTLVLAAKRWLPTRLKSFLFRFSFAVMDEAQQFNFRQRYNMVSMEWSLCNMARIGFRPAAILDIGAYEGEWTRLAGQVFPDARILMVEAQRSKEDTLKRIADASGGNMSCHIALLGPEAKEAVDFYEMELGSSVLHERCDATRRKVSRAMTTLDALMRQADVKRVDFVKLDVQGYELEILKGGEETLRHAEVVLMEVSLLGVIEGAPLMPEVMAGMKQRGFVPYDICTLMRRPLDRALWQVDMVFVKEISPLLANRTKGN